MDLEIALSSQLGPHLKALRRLRGLSQHALGQQIGVGQARVADIEANPGAVGIDQLLRICHVLGARLALHTEGGDAAADAPPRPAHRRGRASRPEGVALAGAGPDDDDGIEALARMLAQPVARLRDAMLEVGRAHPGLVTPTTPIRDIPAKAFAPLARKLKLSPDAFARLLGMTIRRLDATRGTVLDRPAPKGTW